MGACAEWELAWAAYVRALTDSDRWSAAPFSAMRRGQRRAAHLRVAKTERKLRKIDHAFMERIAK